MVKRKKLTLKQKYDKAIELLDIACGWADEIISDPSDSPTMTWVMEEFEKLTEGR